MNSNFRLSVCCLAVAGLFSGCAITGSGTGQSAAQEADPCNPVVAALMGGVAGAIFGSQIEKPNVGAGAAIGATLAAVACGLYNTVTTKQLKSAQQADADFKRANAGRLPDTPTVTTYNAAIESTRYTRGQKARIKSVAELVNGSREPIRSVREEMVMIDVDGTVNEKTRKDKPFTATEGGRFENTFEFTFPEQAPQRRYDFMTRLYVNDKQIRTQRLFTQLAADGKTYEVFAMR